MHFNHNTHINKMGEKIGFLMAYLLFTIILYFILSFLKKMPTTWTYVHIMGIVLIIVLTGRGVRKILQ